MNLGIAPRAENCYDLIRTKAKNRFRQDERVVIMLKAKQSIVNAHEAVDLINEIFEKQNKTKDFNYRRLRYAKDKGFLIPLNRIKKRGELPLFSTESVAAYANFLLLEEVELFEIYKENL